MIGMSVCSGIGAPELSAPWIDWQYQSEIEKFPCAVLAHRFPEATNLGDMTKFEEWPDAAIDVLVGGTPCQDYSVAGQRLGMAGDRGQLTLTFVEIAARYRPDWVVWENVPGVLSSNGGRDFARFLGDLTGQRIAVPSGGWKNHGIVSGIPDAYGIAYCVRDAQYVRVDGCENAVPHRRRRVFVVGYLGDWRRAAAVLLEPQGMRGDSPPRREAGKVAPTIPSRSSGGGGLGTDFDCDGGLIAANSGDVGYCLTASAQQSLDAETETLLAVRHVAAIQERAVCENPNAGPDGAGFRDDGAAYTLEARSTTQAVAFDTTQITSAQNRSNPKPGDPCHPLVAGGHTPAIAFSCKDYGADASDNVSPTLRAMGHAGSHANAGGQMAVAQPHAVRRLLPVECERLQHFPDGWTQVPYRGKPAADGPRYKALGNSWAVNCGKAIFDRIKLVEELT